MKSFYVDIEKQTVTTYNETCNFYEAGLTNNADPVTALSDPIEIKEVLTDQNENEEIEVIFAKPLI
jgi:hypothetical protein